jgi:bifunctional DNA-binding transcriptional regulator/antitoxin component of YhaV-PrlF toxin-antitoxin module
MTESTNGYPLKILMGERITLPKELMREFKLKVGDWVLVDSTGDHMEIVPAEVVPRD